MSEQQHKWTGQSVAGRYLLGSYLGGTDHSAVFATEIVHARAQKVAIKLIPAVGTDIDHQLARWKMLSAISHANLLKIIDYGKCELDGAAHLYVLMEFADEDLADILPQRALNAEETRAMIEPVVETLAFLHGQSLVHTRVHPGNILAIGDQIKLSSDSIAPKGETVSFVTSPEGFAPPESGSGKAEVQEDVWSLGATVVASLTQRAPAFGENGEPEMAQDLPEPFLAIVRESLKNDPAQRTTLAGIRARLNPASQPAVPVATAEAPKEPAKVDPVTVPLSKIPPALASESRMPGPGARAARVSSSPKKSYFLPITAAAVLLVLLFAVPRLFRQHSDAAPAESGTSKSSAEKAPPTKPLSSSKATTTTPKSSSPAPTLTEASQPAASNPAPAIKVASKTATGGAGRGEVLDQVLPDVSEKARATIHGTVRLSLRVHVNATGTVDSAEPEPPLTSQYFTDQAIKAAKRWQFSAPEVNGRSVESDWLLHFEFTPSVTNVRSDQVLP